MNKWILILAVSILSCKKGKVSPSKDALITEDKILTFNKNIQPLIRDKCSPCHVAGGDRGNKYDDYNTFKTLVTGVIGRVIKPKSDPLFMPKNGEKLTENQIATIKLWMDQGYLEK